MYDRILEILSADWLIHKDVVSNYLPLFVSFLNGAKISEADFSSEKQKAFAFRASDGPSPVDRWDLDTTDIPENSIAMIPINGVIRSWQTKDVVRFTQLADSNPRINAIFYYINTPGGMVYYTDITADAIKNTKKPTVGFVSGMAASAGMWIASGMNKIYAGSKLDMLGSIGVYFSYMDFDSFLRDKLGVGIYEIYATKSTRKNEDVRELLKGNEDPITKRADFINEIFHQTVSENRQIALDSEVFTGAIYYAEQAIKLGLANEILSIDMAVEAAHSMGMAYKEISTNYS